MSKTGKFINGIIFLADSFGRVYLDLNGARKLSEMDEVLRNETLEKAEEWEAQRKKRA